jgi:hypothetical protein
MRNFGYPCPLYLAIPNEFSKVILHNSSTNNNIAQADIGFIRDASADSDHHPDAYGWESSFEVCHHVSRIIRSILMSW